MTSLDAEKLSLQWNEFQMNQVNSNRWIQLDGFAQNIGENG